MEMAIAGLVVFAGGFIWGAINYSPAALLIMFAGFSLHSSGIGQIYEEEIAQQMAPADSVEVQEPGDYYGITTEEMEDLLNPYKR